MARPNNFYQNQTGIRPPNQNVVPINLQRNHPHGLDFDKNVLSHRLSKITGEAIQELGRKGIGKKCKQKYSLCDYQAAIKDPQLRACIELKKLRSGGILGQYTHPIPKIQAWVRSILDDMTGTIEDLVSRSAIAPYYGFFTAEIIFKPRRNGYRTEWVLKEFIYHDVVSTGLAGNKYGVTHVIDKSNSPHAWIPVDKCLYIAHDVDNSRNPFGVPSAESAMPYIKARQALISQWLIAGKNHSMGLLVGKASSQNTVTLFDSAGKPMKGKDGQTMMVSSVDYLRRQLSELEDKNYLATELDNDVHWMSLPVDAGFYDQALRFLDKKILLSQNIPSMTFEESAAGLGSATPAMQQMILLDSQIHAAVASVKDQIIEKVIKKMIKFNKRIDPEVGYGDFSMNPNLDPQTASLKTQNLLFAMQSGVISQNDTGATNALRDLLSLPKLEEKEYLETIKKSAEIQAMQQSVMLEAQQNFAGEQQQGQQQQQAQGQGQEQQQQGQEEEGQQQQAQEQQVQQQQAQGKKKRKKGKSQEEEG